MSIVFKENFYKTLEEKQSILPYYSRLTFNSDNSLFYSLNENEDNQVNKVISISLFPSYLSPDFAYKKNINVIRLPQKKINGFAIILKENIGVNDFLKLNYKKKFIQNNNRYLNRFQNCLNPIYKLYFGKITHDKYNYLMSKLKKMIEVRFSQRGVISQNIQDWEYYLKRSYDLINSKHASLFVIYVNEEPVQITLNHHYKKKLFVTITSFDIKYSKFSLGNIAIYKTLEWCLNNNYQLLDMAYGELPYKKAWSNYIYNFEHHILFKKNSLTAKLGAEIEAGIIKTKNMLKSINLDRYFDKRYKKNKTPFEDCKKYTSYTIRQFLKTNKYTQTEFRNENYSCVQKETLDFVFSNKENMDQVKFYKNKSENIFFVLGESGAKRICIHCESNTRKNCHLNKI